METSIEITNDGKVHCEWVKEDAVKGFLMLCTYCHRRGLQVL